MIVVRDVDKCIETSLTPELPQLFKEYSGRPRMFPPDEIEAAISKRKLIIKEAVSVLEKQREGLANFLGMSFTADAPPLLFSAEELLLESTQYLPGASGWVTRSRFRSSSIVAASLNGVAAGHPTDMSGRKMTEFESGVWFRVSLGYHHAANLNLCLPGTHLYSVES